MKKTSDTIENRAKINRRQFGLKTLLGLTAATGAVLATQTKAIKRGIDNVVYGIDSQKLEALHLYVDEFQEREMIKGNRCAYDDLAKIKLITNTATDIGDARSEFFGQTISTECGSDVFTSLRNRVNLTLPSMITYVSSDEPASQDDMTKPSVREWILKEPCTVLEDVSYLATKFELHPNDVGHTPDNIRSILVKGMHTCMQNWRKYDSEKIFSESSDFPSFCKNITMYVKSFDNATQTVQDVLEKNNITLDAASQEKLLAVVSNEVNRISAADLSGFQKPPLEDLADQK